METVKMSECSEEDLDPSDHMTGAGHGRRNIPMRRDSRFYRSVRRRKSNKTGPATEPADNRDCKEDVMNSTSERNSDSSPCWRSPVPQKPALSPLLLGLLDGESLVGRQAEDQAVTATIGPPAEAWKNLIAQRTGVLYQEYGTQSRLQEIQRRRQCDAESDGEPAVRDPALPLQLCRDSPSSTMKLWQNREAVRSSGVLSVLSTEKRQHQEAMFELVTSETSYYKSLELLVTHFQENHQLIQSLSQSEAHFIFSNIRDVKDVSERFLLDLERRVEENVIISDVCDIVSWHASQHFHEFVTYVSNQTYQQRAYRRILKENESFREVMSGLEQAPQCKGLPFTSFLILPFQRITRLKMLVENILKRTAPGSQDEDTATKAFNELKKLIKECNSSVQSMKRTEELIHLNKKIHFEGKIFPLISQSRWLVKHGELVEVDTQTISMSGSKFKLRPVYLHLFNDCLLLSRKKETGKFAVFVHAKIGELKVKDLNMKLHGISGFIFHLQLCEERRLKHQILLKANTESEKQRWIAAMFPSDPVMSKGQISENEDLAQVQCIKSYKAQEHDELTLEKADILQAKTRTSDGWIEGIRLSDGERGWFPRNYVEEITSRSARLRNLRENNRIKCATQKLEEEYL